MAIAALECDAVLGIRTLLMDDPLLTVRAAHQAIVRIVLDSEIQTPARPAVSGPDRFSSSTAGFACTASARFSQVEQVRRSCGIRIAWGSARRARRRGIASLLWRGREGRRVGFDSRRCAEVGAVYGRS